MSNDQNNIQKQRKNEKWVKVQNTQSINRFKHNIASLYRKWKTLDKLETLIEQKKGKNFFFLKTSFPHDISLSLNLSLESTTRWVNVPGLASLIMCRYTGNSW